MPEVYRRTWALYWLVPVAIGAVLEALFLTGFANADLVNQHRSLLLLIGPFCIIAPIGGWWAVYQCIRYEKHPWRYIAVVILVPLGFCWYYFERYLPRLADRRTA